MLTWREQPEEFLEQEDVDTVLEQCSKAELITLIKQMLRRDPDLELLLTTVSKQRKSVDPEVYRRQVAAAFRHGGYDWGAASGIADDLLSIKEIGDGFAQQHDYANATTVYEAIVTGVMEDYEAYNDENGELGSVINECVDEGGVGSSETMMSSPAPGLAANVSTSVIPGAYVP